MINFCQNMNWISDLKESLGSARPVWHPAPPSDSSHTQVVISWQPCSSLHLSVPNTGPQIKWHDYKVSHWSAVQGVLLPSALTDTLVFKHAVSYWQSVTSTEVQHLNTHSDQAPCLIWIEAVSSQCHPSRSNCHCLYEHWSPPVEQWRSQ